MTQVFKGFSRESIGFLTDLRANNNRDWFTTHKSTYEEVIKRPAQQFCEDMIPALTAMMGISYKAKIFRIYRDVRFSKDKTPYNTHLRIAFMPETGGENRPAWMFGLETDHIVLGMGLFGFDKPGLERFRDLIVSKSGAELSTQLKLLEGSGYRIGEPELKRVPSGYPKEHLRAERLRHKSLTVWRDYANAEPAYDAGLIDECLKTYAKMKPVHDWLLKV